MTRRLPFGRFTAASDAVLTEAIRAAGTIASFDNKGIFGDILDRLFFEAGQMEHILGSASQVSSDFATITWDQAQQRFEDKAGSEVLLTDFDRIAVIGMDTLTAGINIDNITGLEMFHIGGTPGQSGLNPRFQMGDQGAGVPFFITLGENTTECKLDLLTDKPFAELAISNLSQVDKRYIRNQGKGNNIKVNGEQIYNPSEAGQIIKYDTMPTNPYLLRLDGSLVLLGTDLTQTWFRDLNIALDGQRWNGTKFVEVQSRFTPTAIPDFIFQLNVANRFFTDISSLDGRVHERTDPTGVSIAESADFVNTSNVVTFPGGIGNVKNGMRIDGTGAIVPDGVVGTTILRNINTTTGTAEMFNALTGVAEPATSTSAAVPVTINNSGAAGGSHDEDQLQNISGTFEIMRGKADVGIIRNTSQAFTQIVGAGVPDQVSVDTKDKAEDEEDFDVIDFSANNSTIEGGGRTGAQTQPRSSGVTHYYKV